MTDDVNIALTLYTKTNFFPIRKGQDSPSSDTVIGSSVISVIVGGIIDGTKLPDPVIITLPLNNNTLISNIDRRHYVINLHCVYWNFTAAGNLHISHALIDNEFSRWQRKLVH